MFNANSKRYEWIEMVLENDALDYYIAVDLQPDNTWTATIINVNRTAFENMQANETSIGQAMRDLNSLCCDYLDRIDH